MEEGGVDRLAGEAVPSTRGDVQTVSTHMQRRGGGREEQGEERGGERVVVHMRDFIHPELIPHGLSVRFVEHSLPLRVCHQEWEGQAVDEDTPTHTTRAAAFTEARLSDVDDKARHISRTRQRQTLERHFQVHSTPTPSTHTQREV